MVSLRSSNKQQDYSLHFIMLSCTFFLPGIHNDDEVIDQTDIFLPIKKQHQQRRLALIRVLKSG